MSGYILSIGESDNCLIQNVSGCPFGGLPFLKGAWYCYVIDIQCTCWLKDYYNNKTVFVYTI